MSTSNGNGTPRRIRTAGLAMFAVAVIAAVVGLVLALTRGEQTTATTGPVPSSVPTSHVPSATAIPSVIPFPPPVISSPMQPPMASPPVPPIPPPGGEGTPVVAPPQGAPAGDGSSDQGVHRGEVRVYNNSTIRGLAARAARDFSDAGWTVVEVGNYPGGIIPTTTVYYQEGTDQRAEAEAMGAQFGMRVEPRFPGIANASPGLIVIVTNDY